MCMVCARGGSVGIVGWMLVAPAGRQAQVQTEGRGKDKRVQYCPEVQGPPTRVRGTRWRTGCASGQAGRAHVLVCTAPFMPCPPRGRRAGGGRSRAACASGGGGGKTPEHALPPWKRKACTDRLALSPLGKRKPSHPTAPRDGGDASDAKAGWLPHAAAASRTTPALAMQVLASPPVSLKMESPPRTMQLNSIGVADAPPRSVTARKRRSIPLPAHLAGGGGGEQHART